MAAQQFFLPFRPAFSSNGAPVPGAKLYFYLTGTTTETPVYTTSSLLIEHDNPVEASGSGRFPAIYLDAAITYRVVLKDADDVTLDDSDPYMLEYSDDALAAIGDQLEEATEMLALASGGINYNSTSSTSLAIGTGSKSLTVETGKLYQVGQPLVIASTADVANWMHGQVTSYNSGTGALVVSVTHIGGSGTIAAWSISPTPPFSTLDNIGLPFIIDGGGATITTGLKGGYYVPMGLTVTGWTILETSGNSGAIVVDVWKDTYANHPPTVADTIAGTEKPTITATGNKGQDTSLTTWTTSIPAGSVIYFNVDSVTTCQRVAITLHGTRTS